VAEQAPQFHNAARGDVRARARPHLHGVREPDGGQRGARLRHAARAGLQQRERAQAEHRGQLAQVPAGRRAAQALVPALRRRHLRKHGSSEQAPMGTVGALAFALHATIVVMSVVVMSDDPLLLLLHLGSELSLQARGQSMAARIAGQRPPQGRMRQAPMSPG